MSIRIECDLFSNHIPRILELAELNRQEAAPDLGPLDVAGMMRLELAHQLICLFAFDEDTIIGYTCYIGTREFPISQGLVYADMLAFYILPEYRGGSTALRLIKEAEKLCKEDGVDFISISARYNTKIDKLAERLGYEPKEVMYRRRL
jgi:GNAT superfamily N-acetyltransferase